MVKFVVLWLPTSATKRDALNLAHEVHSNFLEYYSNFLDKKIYNNITDNYECSKNKIKKNGALTPNVQKYKSNK